MAPARATNTTAAATSQAGMARRRAGPSSGMATGSGGPSTASDGLSRGSGGPYTGPADDGAKTDSSDVPSPTGASSGSPSATGVDTSRHSRDPTLGSARVRGAVTSASAVAARNTTMR